MAACYDSSITTAGAAVAALMLDRGEVTANEAAATVAASMLTQEEGERKLSNGCRITWNARWTAGAAREEGQLGHAQDRWGHGRRGTWGTRRAAGAAREQGHLYMLPAQGPRAHRELLVPPGTQEPRRDAGEQCERREGGIYGGATGGECEERGRGQNMGGVKIPPNEQRFPYDARSPRQARPK